ncbi:MAG: ABC1 kinase family protein [Dehalococcoidia bacterium]
MAFDGVTRARRSLRVARTGAAIYFGYKRTQRRAAKLSPEAANAAWDAQHERAAEALYGLATGLKGLYIKSGQFIGTRTDLVPAAYSKSLSRLQDRVPPRPVAQVRATIEHDLGKPVAALFATFDDQPLAAASLAQVHRATLADGRSVAVKVQYPEVARLVGLDVRNLKRIVGLVARREPNVDYRSIVNEIASQVPLELDFRREAALTSRVAANLAGLPGVVLPEVVASHSAGKVLVTTFLEGERLLDAAAKRAASGLDGARLAQTITEAYGHQILIDGLFQADPHPGNILVLPDGRIGLLDFGLTKELPEASRRGFARLVVAAASRNGPELVAACRELGLKTKSDDPAEIFPLMQLFFDARPAGGGEGGFGGRRQAVRANPIEAIPGDLVLLGRVVGLLRGVCATLGAPLSPMQMLRPHAERVLAESPSMADSQPG